MKEIIVTLEIYTIHQNRLTGVYNLTDLEAATLSEVTDRLYEEHSITPRSVRTDSATNTHYENVENNEKPESTLVEKSESATETASGSKNSLKLNISEDDLCDDTQTSQM